ncbi:MAG: CHASE2 domain-containing protein, partial [Elusimicrobia bacterium]|nr:CHASE2 domain-containing protein [Elusimicrobiota bacterium]
MLRRSSASRWLLAYGVIPPLLLLGALGLWWARVGELEALRLRVFDAYMRAAPRAWDPASPVRIVDIDEASLARLGQWPWPRTLLARLTRRLTDLGAAAVVYDVVFAEPDRTSPEALAAALPPSPELDAVRRSLARLPSHDGVFARAVGAGPVVTGFALSPAAGGRTPEHKAGFLFAAGTTGETLADDLPDLYHGAVPDLAPIEKAASGNGCFSIVPDPDGVHRRVRMLFRLGDDVYPGLAVEALRVAQGARTYKVAAAGSSAAAGMGDGRTGLAAMR